MKLWLNDPKTGKPSVTLSMFVYGFAIATIKLLLSGIEIYDRIKMDTFSGTDYAAVLAALGAIYTIRKNKSIKPDNENKE